MYVFIYVYVNLFTYAYACVFMCLSMAMLCTVEQLPMGEEGESECPTPLKSTQDLCI